MNKIAFGPIPSRRLGRSLGINNIPPKTCTYSCVYCQVGRTTAMALERRAFFAPEDVFEAVKAKVEAARRHGEGVDYLTFVPDGEPTLDVNLARELELLRPLGVNVAVITNSSLLGREDVRADLARADWVSVKVDAVDEEAWRRVNRPHGGLRLGAVLDGISAFAKTFAGTLVTETMLVRDVNDGAEQMREVAGFVAGLGPAVAYLSVPTRPPAEGTVRPPDEEAVARAYDAFVSRGLPTELLIGYPGDAFAFTGNVEDDLLSITAVHPMREEAVAELLAKAGASPAVVGKLVADGTLAEVEFGGKKFYVRTFRAAGGGGEEEG
ncbi:MAG TPA: radical SAM protein [bacterium]|nr:radical SAM protein [bacterium]